MRFRLPVLAGLATIMLSACFVPPGGAGMPCPVQGTVRFRNDFGEPRSGGRTHQGIDIFAPRGRPNVAVVAGRITKSRDRGGDGRIVWLDGKGGTDYAYMHLDAFAGPERRVAAGEVIGYTGDSGNAVGTHTHFETHPGGGAAANPYFTLLRICPDRV